MTDPIIVAARATATQLAAEYGPKLAAASKRHSMPGGQPTNLASTSTRSPWAV
jgi:hypothetical protein